MAMNNYVTDWSDIAFASKKSLNVLKPIFIMAPREMSVRRFKQLIKQYLPQGNIVLGISKEPYVLGLEDQPQFSMLILDSVASVIDKVNTSSLGNNIHVLMYSQRDITFVLKAIDFKKVILVNGSWYTAFHMRPEFYTLVQRQLPHEFVSPFVDEPEAQEYANSLSLPEVSRVGKLTVDKMFELVAQAAKRSFDFGGYQTAVAIGRREADAFEYLFSTHNKVLPYETFAMHFGALREKHFSPMNDLNYYDTIHAEMLAIVTALNDHIDLTDTTLFINLLPCPNCARALSLTGVKEFVYLQDHSAGFAVQILEKAGKKVTRYVPDISIREV